MKTTISDLSSMNKSPRINQDAIEEVIKEAEARHGIELRVGDFKFLLLSTSDFIEKYIDKFIAGAKEHNDGDGDFVSDVDHQTESEKEIFDLWAYNQGRKAKERKCKNS